ncbi:hypothetical protein ACFE04_025496 [Oxalis oulophora]
MSCFSCFSASNIIKIDVDDQDSPYSDGPDDEYSVTGKGGIAKTTEARCFTFRELATATMNFREDKCIGEGGFGKVVAVKRLNLDGLQGHDEFVVEVRMLSVFHHDNLVKLIGYCTQGDQRILVYEYMPKRSLEAHLFGDLNLDQEPLTWNLITGRKALDLSKPTREQNLVAWARHFMNDEKKYSKLADPRLHGNFHVRSFKYAVALAGMCLKEEAHSRPRIRDIVMALEYLSAKSSDHDLKHMGGNNARTTATASQEKRLDSSNSLRSSKST